MTSVTVRFGGPAGVRDDAPAHERSAELLTRALQRCLVVADDHEQDVALLGAPGMYRREPRHLSGLLLQVAQGRRDLLIAERIAEGDSVHDRLHPPRRYPQTPTRAQPDYPAPGRNLRMRDSAATS